MPALSTFSDESFDTIICFQVIEHISYDHALMREMKRVLKNGGVICLTTPNRRMSLPRNPFHIREYNVLNLQCLLPAFMLRGFYSLLNNCYRLLIAKQAPDITSSIHHTDFFLDSHAGNCLDFFPELKKR
ncbi:class I SAM-dependent methyltransferase [Pseudobacter ginsenosidimutans]|uniref:class I SAM-dependent methyltransferase n=1 Tax=Pseudobacter ginsenosidimutans TaxID=661488 RepID=UPI001CEFB03F|nr:methyltransferase domain-containing protein [Pseudobacter ginsenosidimutans]